MSLPKFDDLIRAAQAAFPDAEYITPNGVLNIRGKFRGVERLRVEAPPGTALHFQSLTVDGPDVEEWVNSATVATSSWYGKFGAKFDPRRLFDFDSPTGTTIHTAADNPAWAEVTFPRPLDLSAVRLRNVGGGTAYRGRGIKVFAHSRGKSRSIYDASVRERELSDYLTAGLSRGYADPGRVARSLVPIMVLAFFGAYSPANRAFDAMRGLSAQQREEFRALMSRTVLEPREREWTTHGPQRSFRFWSEQEKADYLREAVEICDSLKGLTAKVCLGFGSALAIVRDGDFIPHDDDLDIIVGFDETEARDLSTALGLVETWLRPRGFVVDGDFTAHRHVKRPGRKNLDVFVGLFEGERISWYPSARRILERDTMYPTSQRSLFGVPCPLPRDPETYLERVYGPGWRQPDPGFTHGWKRSEYVDLVQRGGSDPSS